MSIKITMFALFCAVVVKIRSYIIRNLESEGPSDAEIFKRKVQNLKEKIGEKIKHGKNM